MLKKGCSFSFMLNKFYKDSRSVGMSIFSSPEMEEFFKGCWTKKPDLKGIVDSSIGNSTYTSTKEIYRGFYWLIFHGTRWLGLHQWNWASWSTRIQWVWETLFRCYLIRFGHCSNTSLDQNYKHNSMGGRNWMMLSNLRGLIN